MQEISAFPTVFHITQHKAGSQWIYAVLRECAPQRIVVPQGDSAHFLAQPIVTGMVYPTVYITREQFEAAAVPKRHIKFVVIRDLRDSLVSFYFHSKFSQRADGTRFADRTREGLSESTIQDGLRFLIRTGRLDPQARIQRSWIHSDSHVVRFEDLADESNEDMARLLEYCGFGLSPSRIRAILEAYSFERLSGRPRGTEDINSHYRKGTPGDWRRYLRGDALLDFHDLYGDLIIQAGYANDDSWASSASRTVAAPVPEWSQAPAPAVPRLTPGGPICWCGNRKLEAFGPAHCHCSKCGTIVSSAVTAGDVVASNGRLPLQDKPRHHETVHAFLRGDLASQFTLLTLDKLLLYKPPGTRVLELGRNGGAVSELASHAGYDPTVVEMLPWLSHASREILGLRVVPGPLSVHNLEAGSFGAVILLNTLSFLPSPVETLRHCLELLEPNGILLICEEARPSVGGTYDEMLNRGSPILSRLDPAQRIYSFTESSLQALVRRAGCDEIVAEPINFMQSPRWIGIWHPYFLVAGSRIQPEMGGAQRSRLLRNTAAGRSVEAMLGLQADIAQLYGLRQDDRVRAFDQLQTVLPTELSPLSSRPNWAMKLRASRSMTHFVRSARSFRAFKHER